MRRYRSWLMLALLLALWAWLEWRSKGGDATAETERVAERFTACGRGRAPGCVVDGDSFRIGGRRIRIQGIDAPEMAGSCPSETALAAKSRDRLIVLLNQGPFTLVARSPNARDQYGRDLRIVERAVDGRRQSIGATMVRERLARDYVDRKSSWC